MRKLAANHKEELIKYTNVDYDSLTKLTYLHEFDRAYQCPTWGYPTEDAYYRDASSNDSLLAVRIPLLCLNAEDDPIASKWGLPRPEAAQNPYTVLCTTSLGGHIGWYELGGGRWHAKPVSQRKHGALRLRKKTLSKPANNDTRSSISSTAWLSRFRRRASPTI